MDLDGSSYSSPWESDWSNYIGFTAILLSWVNPIAAWFNTFPNILRFSILCISIITFILTIYSALNKYDAPEKVIRKAHRVAVIVLILCVIETLPIITIYYQALVIAVTALADILNQVITNFLTWLGS